MARNTLKYRRMDPLLRAGDRTRWNPPLVWPVIVLLATLTVLLISGIAAYRRRERDTAL
jgi:hypothetical protein